MMIMSNSNLIVHTNISPNRTSPRNHKIDRFTIHCFVGSPSVEAGCKAFESRLKMASCNYYISPKGQIGLVCPESDRSWCSSSSANDHRAITIEMASGTKDPYEVTDEALSALIRLIADCCKRNGINKVIWMPDQKKALAYAPKDGEAIFTLHKWFKNKACPGSYLISKHPFIADSVNAVLNAQKPILEPLTSFKVKVIDDGLNIRKEPKVKIGNIVGKITDHGVYTIVDVSGNWGLLKTYAAKRNGWINISDKYVKRV